MASVVGKPGARLRSTVSAVEIIVVRPAVDEITLECGGKPMADPASAGAPDGSYDGEPVALGKRYFDEVTGLEALCVKGGAGPLSVDGRPLQVRGARTLPSSD